MRLTTHKVTANSSYRLSVFTGWLVALTAISLTALSFRFLSSGPDLSAWQNLHFAVYSVGHYALLTLLIDAVLVLGIGRLVPLKFLPVWATVVTWGWLTTIVADTFVFELYRFHLNMAVLDLFIHGGSEIIHFSFEMWCQIILIAGGVAAAAAAVVWCALYLSRKPVRARWSLAALFVCLLAGNLTHAVGVAKNLTGITTIAENVPWAFPLQMNSAFKKLGILEVVEQTKVKSVDANGSLSYPLHPLTFAKAPEKPLNIVIILNDCLRSDMLNEAVMPYSAKWARQSLQFTDHYSAGNATRAGVFGLLQGLPPNYWHSALAGNVPSAFITALQTRGYDISTFASASLAKPEFSKTVFASVPNIRLHSQGSSAWERDMNSVADFSAWLEKRDVSRPFFSFVFLDNIHGYSLNPKAEQPFAPAWQSVNNLKLSKDMDPTKYFNLYKNCAHEADRSVEMLRQSLEKKGLLDNTVVIVSSDHGEEFNDNKLGFWGHNSNFTDAQIKIPLFIHWPGKAPRVYTHQTTAYDITATLMPDVLGVTNPTADYSVGHSLWTENPRSWFISGSYQNTAIVEKDRLVLINSAGLLSFKDRTNRATDNDKRTANLLEAIELLSRYRKRY